MQSQRYLSLVSFDRVSCFATHALNVHKLPPVCRLGSSLSRTSRGYQPRGMHVRNCALETSKFFEAHGEVAKQIRAMRATAIYAGKPGTIQLCWEVEAQARSTSSAL
eukprot:3716400-Amphidinium_carterae.1